MYLLVETVRIENGQIMNIHFHNERMIRSLYNIYGIKSDKDLEKIILVPPEARHGIFKCRVLYDDKTASIEIMPYTIRSVRSLKIVFSDDICYPYKYIHRDRINRLFDMRGGCDDILVVKYGKLTDSSYANVILKDYEGNWKTPSTYLLPGTRRASLLKSGLIKEADIYFSEISKFTELKLINAMMGIEDTEGFPVGNLNKGD
jgi:4-amino-4-deoxychorismate lyase